MTKVKLIVIFIAGFVIVGVVNAASFDCKKAGSIIEHIICSNEELSILDEELAKAYKNAKQHTDQKVLKKEQINWIKTKRSDCKDVQCLRNVYVQRIEQLNSYNTTNNFVNEMFLGEWVSG
ncbi:lysozyme inhibitor LprI family protein, partial [Desulfamplus magnetovallimortis]|uniref:lysozyme inhibitor LprI family protein n=1 Tax=Desulfamplus magnetovallimortis TaxID=1246637 RepID=UPI00111955D4